MQENYSDNAKYFYKRFSLSHYPAFKFLLLLSFFLLTFSYLEINRIFIFLGIILVVISFIFIHRIPKIITYSLITATSAAILLFRINYNSYGFPCFVVNDVPAVFVGNIEKIVSVDTSGITAKVYGSLRSSQLKAENLCRINLRIFNIPHTSVELASGSKIYTTLKVRPPREKILPTEFDEQFYAKFSDIQWMASADYQNITVMEYNRNFYYYSQKIAEAISLQIDKLFLPQYTPIIKAVLLGDKSQLKDDTKAIFSAAGTAHVLAVSGLHVGIISSIILLLLSGFDNQKLKFILFTALIFTYAAITGFSPSVLRAGLMAVVLYFVYSAERRPNFLNIIAFSLVLLIFIEPSIIYSPAFQMSGLSILSIALIYPVFSSGIRKILFFPNSKSADYIINSFSVSLAVSVIVSPLTAYYFRTFSLVSPLANLFIIPLISAIMIFSVISLIISVLYFPFGLFYAGSVNILLKLCIIINQAAMHISDFALSKENLFWIAILISAGIFYILSSGSRQKFFFRTGAAAAILFPVIYIINLQNDLGAVNIYPLEKICAAEIRLSQNKTFIYIADRRNHNYYFPDNHLLRYLSQSNDELALGITGNIGLATANKLKQKKPCKIVELSHQEQKQIEKILNLKQPLSQIIHYKK